jgi:hypothetical protein
MSFKFYKTYMNSSNSEESNVKTCKNSFYKINFIDFTICKTKKQSILQRFVVIAWFVCGIVKCKSILRNSFTTISLLILLVASCSQDIKQPNERQYQDTIPKENNISNFEPELIYCQTKK